MLLRVGKDVGVLTLPAIEPLLRGFGLAVHLDEREKLCEEPITRALERPHGALEPLQELRPDKPDDLELPVVLDRVD